MDKAVYHGLKFHVWVIFLVSLVGCSTSLRVDRTSPDFNESVFLDQLQYCRARHESGTGGVEGLFYLVAQVAPTEGIVRSDSMFSHRTADEIVEDTPTPTPKGRRLEDYKFDDDDSFEVSDENAAEVVNCLKEKGYNVALESESE